MKKYLTRIVSFCVGFLFLCSIAYSQDRPATGAGYQFLISAKAGGVNYVEGTVAVVRKDGKSGVLLKGDALEIGDRVSTGADGKAEILLNPGSYLRLGGNSAFEFITTSLEDLQLRLDSGSAILEVFATEEFTVVVNTPKTKYFLIDTGVFRINVPSVGEGRLEVRKGYARVGTSPELIKPGRAVTTSSNGSVSIAKFDRGEMDSLDIWSKDRGKELAKLTERLKRGDVRTSLMRSFLGRSWNLFGSFGLWVWDPYFGGYCFLPFGRGWYSPYGYGYGNYIGWYDLPPVIWYPPHHTTGGGNNGTGNGGNPPVTPIVSAGTRGPVPPFIRMQDTMGGGGIRGGGRGGDLGGNTYDPSPSYSPSSSGSSSPPPPAPPPPSTLGTGKGDTKP